MVVICVVCRNAFWAKDCALPWFPLPLLPLLLLASVSLSLLTLSPSEVHTHAGEWEYACAILCMCACLRVCGIITATESFCTSERWLSVSRVI